MYLGRFPISKDCSMSLFRNDPHNLTTFDTFSFSLLFAFSWISKESTWRIQREVVDNFVDNDAGKDDRMHNYDEKDRIQEKVVINQPNHVHGSIKKRRLYETLL